MPEKKYRTYKSCGEENIRLMEEIMAMRSETVSSELNFSEKFLWSLIGAGVLAISHEVRQ